MSNNVDLATLQIDNRQANRSLDETTAKFDQNSAAAEKNTARISTVNRAFDALASKVDGTTQSLKRQEDANRRVAAMEAAAERQIAAGKVTREQANAVLEEYRRKTLAAAQQTKLSADATAAAAMAAAQLNQHVSSAGNGAAKFRGAMQQAGYQIADFATQASMGGNIMQAFGVQFGQLISVVGGPWGAAAGAAITVGGILAGTMLNTKNAADANSTAFHSYAAAMDLATKAAEAANGASAQRKTALDAERRSVISAREEVVKKAEADLLLAQAALSNAQGDLGARRALGSGTLDDVVAQRKKNLASLQQQLDVLKGTWGLYNDGARDAAVREAAAGKTTADYAENVRALNDGLRNQIAELGFQVDAQDRSNAAKLRAKLQSEAMTASGVAEYSAVNSGTRALIDQAVARQEQIDKLDAETKAGQKAATQASANAKAYKTVTDELTRGIAEQQRLAGVVGQSVEAQRAADTATATAAALAKAHTTATTAEGKAIAALVAEHERWKAAVADSKVLDSSKTQLAYAREELSLMGRAEPVRARALKSFQIQQQAGELAKTTTAENVAEWVRLQEAIADTQALTSYRRQVEATAADISKSWTETIYDALTMKDKTTSVLDAVKALGKRISLAMLESKIVMPITTEIVNAAPDLFGISRPRTSPAITGAAGRMEFMPTARLES